MNKALFKPSWLNSSTPTSQGAVWPNVSLMWAATSCAGLKSRLLTLRQERTTTAWSGSKEPFHRSPTTTSEPAHHSWPLLQSCSPAAAMLLLFLSCEKPKPNRSVQVALSHGLLIQQTERTNLNVAQVLEKSCSGFSFPALSTSDTQTLNPAGGSDNSNHVLHEQKTTTTRY